MIVLDYGSLYSKIGFQGDLRPKVIITNRNEDLKVDVYHQNLLAALSELAGLSEKDDSFSEEGRRSLLFCEGIGMTNELKRKLSLGIYEWASRIYWFPSSLAALFATPHRTGLVIDLGYASSSILPIFASYPLFTESKSSSFGGELLSQRFKTLLPALETSTVEEMEMIKLKVFAQASPSSTSAPAKLEFTNQGQKLIIPASIVDKVISEEEEVLEDGLYIQVLNCLLASPIDVRMPLIENILLIGGLSMIPAIQRDFVSQLIDAITNSLDRRYDCLRGLLKHTRFIHLRPDYPSDLVAWIGGSLLDVKQISPSLAISRDAFLKGGTSNIPDWSRKDLPEREGLD